jgi:dTDP-4-amino-4,6-dideoxygalactose transaminase
VLAERVRTLRQYGWDRERLSERAGMNSRLDELQAAVLRVKLARLGADNARRQAVANAYDAALLGTPTGIPVRRADRTHVFHQYVVRRPDRDEVRRRLEGMGIGTAIHYAAAAHQQPAYAGRVDLGPRRCRTTEAVVGEILSLPMHPHLGDQDLAMVCEALRRL